MGSDSVEYERERSRTDEVIPWKGRDRHITFHFLETFERSRVENEKEQEQEKKNEKGRKKEEAMKYMYTHILNHSFCWLFAAAAAAVG